MGLETGNTIAQLNAAWPLGTDARSQGDDHLRLVKAVVKNDVASKALTTLQTFAGPLRIADYYIGANPAGAVNAGYLSAITGAPLYFVSGVDTGGLMQVRTSANVQAAIFEPGGTAISGATAVLTKEKGDARYLQLSAGAGSALIGTLVTRPASPLHWTLDNALAGGSAFDINTIGAADASAQTIRFGRSSPAGNIALALNDPGTTTARVILRSDGTGKVEAGVGALGSYYIGANPAGVVNAGYLSAITGNALYFVSGVSTGGLMQVRTASNVQAAIFEPGGTAISGATAVVTREKGDLRYAQLAAALNTFEGDIDLPYVYASRTTATAANQYINTNARLYRSTSSGEFKIERKPVENAGVTIDALDPLSFESTHEVDEGRRFIGFIAEDVAASLPEASTDNGENYDVRALVAVLWSEVRHLRGRLLAAGV